MDRQHLILPGDGTDFAHWRRLARWLWAQQVPPQLVEWQTEAAHGQHPDLFTPTPQVTPCEDLPPTQQRPLTVPRWWPELAEHALLHHSPERFALLYRLLWRMQHTPSVRHDPLDADRVHLQYLCKAVRREVHQMHAFVRFRPVALADALHDGSGPLHVAWFEPQHHIVHAVAPFFVGRFSNMRWAILTPLACLRWWPQAPCVAALAGHGIAPQHALQPLAGRPGVLSWGPGASADAAPPADAGEALWLTYYAHIFNPARLKVATMCREMPRHYWAHLPEAQLITPLVQAAQARSAAMLANAPSMPQRKLPRRA